MILHLVAFSFKESASEADRQAIIAELAELPDHYPTMQRFAIGPNISQRDELFPTPFPSSSRARQSSSPTSTVSGTRPSSASASDR